MINIPVFVICLLSARASLCNKALPKLQHLFHNVSIFPAVESSSLSMNDNRISPYARYHITHKLDIDLSHISSMGAIGCYLSHIQLWKRALELNTSIIIMEDDVPVDLIFLQNAIQQIPEHVDHASIIYFPWVGSADCTDTWCTPKNRNSVFGTQMYYVTPKGASILLEQALPIVSPVDIFILYVANTRSDFNSVFYKTSFFPFYQPIVQEMQSTIGRHVSIKKIAMPESNIYYIIFLLILLIACIRPKFHSKCICKTNNTHHYRKILDNKKLVDV